MPILLALLSSALWGWADFRGGTLSRRLPTTVVVGLSQGCAFVALVPLVLALGDRPDSLLAGALAGVVLAVGLAAFYGALAVGTMGVVAPVSSTGAIVPVVVGLARGEQPSSWQLVGIVIALVGVVLASGPELSGGAARRPLVLALVAAGCFGTVLLLFAEAAEGPAGGVLVSMLVLRAAMVTALAPWALRSVRGTDWRAALPSLALLGVIDVAANTTFTYATRGSLLSVVAVCGSLYPVVTVLLARQVHGERLQRVQGVGVAASLAGIVLLASG